MRCDLPVLRASGSLHPSTRFSSTPLARTRKDPPAPQPEFQFRVFAEIDQHRRRSKRHEQDDAEGGQVGEPGEQLQDRVGVQRGENQHHHRSNQALQDRTHVRTLVHPMGRSQATMQQPVTADGVEIARRGVVERQQPGVDADHEQHADDAGQVRADKMIGHAIDKRRRVLQGLQRQEALQVEEEEQRHRDTERSEIRDRLTDGLATLPAPPAAYDQMGQIIVERGYLNALAQGTPAADPKAVSTPIPGVGTITRHVLKRMRPDAKMIVVESGPQRIGTWVEEERNVYEDYRLAFGEEPPAISGVAIMSDTDNTKERAVAYYGDIVFVRALK